VAAPPIAQRIVASEYATAALSASAPAALASRRQRFCEAGSSPMRVVERAASASATPAGLHESSPVLAAADVKCGGQASHGPSPRAALKVSAGHCTHVASTGGLPSTRAASDACSAALVQPATQSHVASPGSAQLPFAHATHSPYAPGIEPAGQAEQDLAPAPERWPARVPRHFVLAVPRSQRSLPGRTHLEDTGGTPCSHSRTRRSPQGRRCTADSAGESCKDVRVCVVAVCGSDAGLHFAVALGGREPTQRPL